MCKNIYLQFKSDIPRASPIVFKMIMWEGEIHAGESFFLVVFFL